jgi:hypothetical protein
MPTATTTPHDTGRQVSPDELHCETQSPVTQRERNAIQRLRTTFAPVRLAFTWLGVRSRVGARHNRVARHRQLAHLPPVEGSHVSQPMTRGPERFTMETIRMNPNIETRS